MSVEPTNEGNSKETNSNSSATINIPAIGFPGEPYSMVLTNIFGPPQTHLNTTPPWGNPGQYTVTYVLSKPGFKACSGREIKFAEFTQGDSHFAILAPAFPAPLDAVKIRLDIHLDSQAFTFEGTANEAGFLAKLETFPFNAQNRNDAEMRATRAVQGVLSEYSSQLDIPLLIELIEVTELATSNKSLTLVAPFLSGGTSAPIDTYDREFANMAGLYREGLLSNSPVYRFLCFYKILEVSRKRRERIGRKLKKAYDP